jgi:hypothetical protein
MIAAQLGRGSNQRDGALVGVEKSRQHLASRPRPKRRHQQVAVPLALECPMIAWRFRGGFLKALQRALESFTRSEAEEVIAVADQRVGFRNAEAVAALWLMDNPRSTVSQDPPHFGNGDVHRMARHDRAVPRFANQLIAVNDASAVRRQRPERVERLRPHAKLGAAAE